MKRVLAMLLLCAPVAAFAAQVFGEPGPVAVAPAWSLKTPQGQVVNYPADARGRPTVLLFWPSWCPFSRALQPYVQDIWTDYRDRGVNVWTINIREDGDPLQAMRDRGLSFPLLLDGDALIPTYKITRTPWFVVIDGAQNIVYTRPAHPPTPIDVAKAARETLNALLGDRAVPLPAQYPPPYDLHLKRQEDLPDRRAPAPIPDAEWERWVRTYLLTIPAGESRPDLPAQGDIANGKDALARARQLWTQAYGAAEVQAQAPYRALRLDRHWVVLGQPPGAALGEGLILVIEHDGGRVVRLQRAGSSNLR